MKNFDSIKIGLLFSLFSCCLYSMELVEYDGTVSIWSDMFYSINSTHTFPACPVIEVDLKFEDATFIPQQDIHVKRMCASLPLTDLGFKNE